MAVGDIDKGDPKLALEFLQLALHLDRHVGVQCRKRLVQKQHLGFQHQAAGQGNALALVEMIHLLVDAGVIDATGDPWSIDASQVDDIALPTTVQAIVQAAQPGDHILVMSNGGFGGVHQQLVTKLEERVAKRG